MKHPRNTSKRWPATLLCAAMLFLPACKGHRNQWSFSATRSVYGKGGGGVPVLGIGRHHHHHDNGAGAIILLAIILLPVVFDLVALPVTLTHDLCE